MGAGLEPPDLQCKLAAMWGLPTPQPSPIQAATSSLSLRGAGGRINSATFHVLQHCFMQTKLPCPRFPREALRRTSKVRIVLRSRTCIRAWSVRWGWQAPVAAPPLPLCLHARVLAVRQVLSSGLAWPAGAMQAPWKPHGSASSAGPLAVAQLDFLVGVCEIRG